MYSFLSIPTAHAQLPLPAVVKPIASGATALDFVCTVVFTWLFTAAIIFAIALVLVAAFRYMTSDGVPDKIKSANKMLIFAAVGIAVAILARSVPVIVGSFVAKDVNLDPCATKSAPPPTPPTGN